jgi:hypothetical protein
MGVCPAGPHVRRRVGMSRKPLSSRKTRWAPSRCAFFYMRPLVAFPMSNGLVVPLNRSALGDLTRPPRTSQQPPEVIGVVHHTELPADDGGDAFQRPQIVRKTVDQCPFRKKLQKPPTFVLSQFPRTTRDRFGLQSGRALFEYRLLPSENRGKRGADAPRDLLQTPTALEQCDGLLPTPFQRLRGSPGSHASYIGILLALL